MNHFTYYRQEAGKDERKDWSNGDGSSCGLVTKLCLTLCNSMDCSPPGFSVRGILQSRILEWVAISFSKGSFWPRDGTQVSSLADGFFTTKEARKEMNTNQEISFLSAAFWASIHCGEEMQVKSEARWGFPGGPAAKTPHPQCRGFDPWPLPRWSRAPAVQRVSSLASSPVAPQLRRRTRSAEGLVPGLPQQRSKILCAPPKSWSSQIFLKN